MSSDLTVLPTSTSYTHEVPNDSPSGLRQEGLGRESRITDIGGKEAGVSYDKRLKDCLKADLLKFTNICDILCISR